MATNEKSELPPPSYNTATAPEYPQPMPMPQSMSSPMNPTMSSPMHQPMLQPMPPQMQQTFSPPGGSFQPQLPARPTTLMCPFCRNQIVTKVEYQVSLQTHLIAAMCCMLGCCLCMWIPYCNNTFKTPEHYCPTCNTYLGTCTDTMMSRSRSRYYHDY